MDHGHHPRQDGTSMLPPSYASSSARSKPTATPSIDVPSFSAFQAQTSRVKVPTPVRRKPLPPSASPVITRRPSLSSGGRVIAVRDDDSAAHAHVSFQESAANRVASTPSNASPPLVVRDLDQFPRGHSPHVTPNPQTGSFPEVEPQIQSRSLPERDNNATPTRAHHVRLASDPTPHDASKSQRAANSDGVHRAATMSSHLGVRPNALQIVVDRRSFTPHDGQDPSAITKTPRSPGPNKLTSFFGWKTSSPIAEMSPSTYSGRSHSPNHSPMPSPLSPSPLSHTSQTFHPQAMDGPKANGSMRTSYIADTGFPLPPQTGSASAQIADMDEELREVSSELAGSIRREMELEDLVDRLQLEAQQGPEPSRRTSDYFSDSGTSSTRYPPSDAGGLKTEDIAKMKRVSELEKAQFKLDLSQKLQEERGRRKVLEAHIQQLAQQVQHMDEERARSSNVASRVRELENALEDMRRRLLEERRGKENFEDLLTAMRGEIQQHRDERDNLRDERDNLRDEVVPQLKARLEGLEGASLEHEKLAYDNAKMQQELQSLKNENTTLMNARRLQLEMQQHASRFTAIAEEDEPSPLASGIGMGLTRSNSVSRSMGGRTRAGSLAWSNSISAKEREPRDSLADRIKDIEMQRDELHSALRRLLDRQTYQKREHDKQVQALATERDRALQGQGPRRVIYERDALRNEIHQLRRRADEALVQKWQCEKGLSGLKMDLDRAEQETSSLRTLLQEHDILIPELPWRRSEEIQHGAYATSASLEKAYQDLRETQVLSISKLQKLCGEAPSSAEDADMAETMDLLLRSMSDAEAERDHAQSQAALYRAQAESLQESESFHSSENVILAGQLRASASRVEALAQQVRVQLESNRELRERLAEAVGRGEREQRSSAARINGMQEKLKVLEDRLMTAQQHSEDAFAHHEAEVREIQDSHNLQLQRIKSGLRTPTLFTPKSPMSPMFSPRLDKTTSGTGMSMTEALRTEVLERKVVELEGALSDADKEMEEVVGRMNMAQIEVMELQSARDEAMRQTRKLQAAIVAEREQVDSLMK